MFTPMFTFRRTQEKTLITKERRELFYDEERKEERERKETIEQE